MAAASRGGGAPWPLGPSAVSREAATPPEVLGLPCGGPASSSPSRLRAGFRSPVLPLSTPQRVGVGVTWPGRGHSSGAVITHPPEHLGESGRGSLIGCRVVELIRVRESGAGRGSRRLPRSSLSASAVGPALESRSDLRGLSPTRPAIALSKGSSPLCLLAGVRLALAAVRVQVALLEGVGYANFLVSRRTSLILKQLNYGSHHFTFLLIRLFTLNKCKRNTFFLWVRIILYLS